MLNRSAVIVRPKKPFLDWVRAVDYDDAPEVTPDQIGPSLYLVPDYEDPADADKVLKKVCEEIFCRELEGWYTDEDVWPKDRSLKVFKQWFDVQHYEIVEDVGRGPVENDEGPEEKHRFSPAPPPRKPPPRKKTVGKGASHQIWALWGPRASQATQIWWLAPFSFFFRPGAGSRPADDPQADQAGDQ